MRTYQTLITFILWIGTIVFMYLGLRSILRARLESDVQERRQLYRSAFLSLAAAVIALMAVLYVALGIPTLMIMVVLTAFLVLGYASCSGLLSDFHLF